MWRRCSNSWELVKLPTPLPTSSSSSRLQRPSLAAAQGPRSRQGHSLGSSQAPPPYLLLRALPPLPPLPPLPLRQLLLQHAVAVRLLRARRLDDWADLPGNGRLLGGSRNAVLLAAHSSARREGVQSGAIETRWCEHLQAQWPIRC